MAKTIAYTVQCENAGKDTHSIVLSNEVADYLETDRRRKQAEKKRDERHLSKRKFEQDRLPKRLLDRHALENECIQNIRVQTLYAALATLSAQERRLLYQAHWQEKTMGEIGATLGISKMAVSKRLQKLYGALRGLVF